MSVEQQRHQHTEYEHCTHIKDDTYTPAHYRYECSCGTVGRWHTTERGATVSAALHIRVWTEESIEQ